jgi:ATP-binding cassette subfamily C protein LapB
MAGLYAPMKGSVTVAGLDMSQLADEVLRRHVGYLPQDTRLLNGTLRENLLLGLPNPGDDQLMATADSLGLAPMIASHPMGMDLPIAEGGRGLSGGQRTLAGLTRMLLANPKVWLLDEPTANLDQSTEVRVLDALRRSMTPESTLVLVTHRLQLLSLVERVIVMVNGQIRLDGTPKEVLTKLQAPPPRADPGQVPQTLKSGATPPSTPADADVAPAEE